MVCEKLNHCHSRESGKALLALAGGHHDFLDFQRAGARALHGQRGAAPDPGEGIDLAGAEVVVVGHGEIVGKTIAMFLLHHLSTVTVCHVKTRNVAEHTRRADILVVAVGKAGLVTARMIKPGAVVIDIGIDTAADGSVVGDVEYASSAEIAGWITPVPGGVGPVTVAMLMRNTLRAAGLNV